MSSTVTSQNINEDTVLSILKDIRDLLRHQEGRIKRLEDDNALTLPESPWRLSNAERGKSLDGQPSGSDDGDETGKSAQQADDQTHITLSRPSQPFDKVASTFSARLPRSQSDSGPPPSNEDVNESGNLNQPAEHQTQMSSPHLREVFSASSSRLPQPQSNSGLPSSNEEDGEDRDSIQPPKAIRMRPPRPSQPLDELASTSHSSPQSLSQSNLGQQEMTIAPAEPEASKTIDPERSTGQKLFRLPPPGPDIGTELPMPLISWLAKIPDDRRLRFGFSTELMNQDRWKLYIYRKEKRLEDRPMDVHYQLPDSTSIEAAFNQFDRLMPGHGMQFFVRDNCPDGNRLYQQSGFVEYPNKNYYPGDPILSTGSPYEYYFTDQMSTWYQKGQAILTLCVPSSDREKQENEDAPEWRRIVVLRGIESTLIPAYGPYDRHESSSYDGLDMLFTDTWELILNHLNGNQSWEYYRFFGAETPRILLNIQICGYKMHDSSMYEHLPIHKQKSSVIETAKEHPVRRREREEYVHRIEYLRWKTGKMYEFEGQQLTKQIYTVAVIYLGEDRDLDNVKNWTLLFAGPAGSDNLETENRMEELAFGVLPTLPFLLFHQATWCLARVREGYEELLDRIESNLGDRDGILDPDNHSKLLIEDQSFERSRRYFWTIDALDTFSGTLEESLKTFEQFTKAIGERSSAMRSAIHATFQGYKNAEDIWEGVQKGVSETNILLERIKAIKERTITLRDGLFNASSVFESRASTRLGETVKLLTYVTIFYLPLAFCATLWAVPDNFGGMHIFALVITVVSLATYIVVFNLNHLTFYLVTLHQQIRRPLTKWMDSEPNEDGKPSPWAERGRRFRRWKPGQPDPAPSEWLILWYGLFCIARVFGIIQLAGMIAKATNFFRKIVRKFKRRREVPLGENP